MNPNGNSLEVGPQIKCIAGGHVEGAVMITTSEFLTLEESKNDTALYFNQFKGLTMACPSAGSIHEVIIKNDLNFDYQTWDTEKERKSCLCNNLFSSVATGHVSIIERQ